MFTFKVHPAAISVTDGVGHAAAYFTASWRAWGPVVLGLAAVNLVFFLIIGDIAKDGLYYVDERTNRMWWASDAADKIWRMVPFFALLVIASVVATWAFAGIAIAGLRGWRLTVSVVVRRGMVALGSSLIVSVFAVGAGMLLVLLIVAVPVIGVLALFAAIFVWIYVAVRIAFSVLAIFEGFGPIAGLQESWRLSEGAVLRMIGWALMFVLISIAFSLVATMASAPIMGSDTISVALSQGISSAITGAGTALGVFMLAVLYESQRARHDPSLYPVPAYPYPSAPPAWPGALPPGSYPPPAEGAGQAPPGWPPQSS